MTAINFTNALGVHEQALHLRTPVSYTHLTLPTKA